MIPQAPPAVEQRVVLKPAQLLCEEAVADPKTLIDEPSDPAGGKGGAPKSVFFPGWESAWRYPIHVTIDLGAEREVTRLFFYIEGGGGSLGFSTGMPFDWSAERSVPRDGYKSWKEVPIGAKTRYVRLEIPGPTAVPELVVYARPGDKPAPDLLPKKPAPRVGPTMDALIGVNAFIDDPLDKLTPVAGFVREYHSWSWDTENPDRRLRFQPSAAAGGNSWFFDDFYAALHRAGVTVAPALQGNAGGLPFDEKPDFDAHAAYLFQFAARYGAAPVADSRLSLAPGQPRVSGRRSLRYLENWNEPDKTWKGRAGWFSPFELAEMTARDRDGVKRADPSMKLVLGGLAGLNLAYLDAIKHWADFHRAGKFPADVINLHHYCSDGKEQSFGKTGISPEADDLRGKLTAAARWRDANAPDAELWLTEFGWDTDPRSPIHAPALGTMDAQTVQAAWLARAYFLLAAAGVDRAAMFMFRDVNSTGGGVFETCGLVTQKGEWKPKTSWFWVATLKNRLKGFRFVGDVQTGRSDVTALRFSDGKRDAYALWCPTSEDRTVTGFAFKTPFTRADLVALAAGEPSGRASVVRAKGGALSLTVTERPQLVFPRR